MHWGQEITLATESIRVRPLPRVQLQRSRWPSFDGVIHHSSFDCSSDTYLQVPTGMAQSAGESSIAVGQDSDDSMLLNLPTQLYNVLPNASARDDSSTIDHIRKFPYSPTHWHFKTTVFGVLANIYAIKHDTNEIRYPMKSSSVQNGLFKPFFHFH